MDTARVLLGGSASPVIRNWVAGRWREERRLLAGHRDQCDIIGRPARRQHTQQPVACRLRTLDGQGGGDFAVRNHAVHPVAAQKEDVADLGFVGDRVHFETGLDTRRPRQHVRHGVLPRLVGRQQAALHHLLHLSVVAGEAVQLAAPQQIGTAVASPEDGEAPPADHQRHHGRTHLLADPRGLVVDQAIRGVDRLRDLQRVSIEVAGHLGPWRMRRLPPLDAHSPRSRPPIPSATAQRPTSARSAILLLDLADIAPAAVQQAKGPTVHAATPSTRSSGRRSSERASWPSPPSVHQRGSGRSNASPEAAPLRKAAPAASSRASASMDRSKAR